MAGKKGAVSLCCAVLCCAVLCCAVLCCESVEQFFMVVKTLPGYFYMNI